MLFCHLVILGVVEKHTDDEFYLLFTVIDENLSHYLDENIVRFAFNPSSVDKEDEDFKESNLMHGKI